MSDTRPSGVSEGPIIPRDTAIFKEAALILGWIAGLVIIAGLCWSLTGPVRNRFLLNAINRVMEQSGDSRRLAGPVTHPVFPEASGSFAVGTWFTVSDGTKALVFTFIGEGTFFPCAAVLGPEGKVKEFIPLNSYGKRTIKLFPAGILKLNARRIEGIKS